jgi:hypothetical protein
MVLGETREGHMDVKGLVRQLHLRIPDVEIEIVVS